MALPLPQGKHFTITYRNLSGDFEMPSMEVASDHYSLGFIIHGGRKVITPTMTYTLHAGYVNAMAPYLYHRTIPASGGNYESYLIKFSPEYVRDFTNAVGSQIIDNIFADPPKHFDEKDEMDISLECGFSYPGNMTASFKKEFGMTPLQFRKQNRKQK